MKFKKEKGLPNANRFSPKQDALMKIIAQCHENVKENRLKDFRELLGASPREIVACVRTLHPGYDKMLQSKCEHGDVYGITLRNDTFNAIVQHFAPEQAAEIKRIRGGSHKFTKQVCCRLSDEDYDRFTLFIDRAGYKNAQAALTAIIKQYIRTEEQINGND